MTRVPQVWGAQPRDSAACHLTRLCYQLVLCIGIGIASTAGEGRKDLREPLYSLLG